MSKEANVIGRDNRFRSKQRIQSVKSWNVEIFPEVNQGEVNRARQR